MSDASFRDPQLLRAAVDHGFELHEAGDLEATLAHYDGVLATAPAGTDPVTVESLFAARFDRAVVLTELGELAPAAEAFAAAARGLPAGDPEVAHEIAMAELNRGVCLQLLDRHGDALTVYSAIVGRFPDATDDAVLREQVAKAMVNRCATLEALGRSREAVDAVDAALDHLTDVDDLWAEDQRAILAEVRTSALASAEA